MAFQAVSFGRPRGGRRPRAIKVSRVLSLFWLLLAANCTQLDDVSRSDGGSSDTPDSDGSSVSPGPVIVGEPADAASGDDGSASGEGGNAPGQAGADGGSAAAANDGAVADGMIATGGTSETGADAGSAREPCTTAAALRCAAGAAREVCMNGIWQAGEPCPRDTVCTTDDPARCPSLLAACVGNLGKSVCTGSAMQHCNDRGLSTGTETCQSERLCQLGLDKGHCLKCAPGSFKCTGAKLEKCSDDGEQWLASQTCTTAALCNETAGACTSAACSASQKRCTGDTLERCNAGATGFELDTMCMPALCDQVGQQCDICLPKSRSCASTSSYRLCVDSGQSYTTAACPSTTPYCTGSGSCTACLNDAHCADPGECRSATCSAGACVPSNDRISTSCKLASGGSGLCDGAGNCLQCLNEGDACTLSAGGSGICNDKHACVQCNQPSDCKNTINSCQERTCSAAGVCGTRARTGNTCASGYCNSAAQCVACLESPNTCSGSLPYCVSAVCRQCTLDSHCGSTQLQCRNNQCINRCGNGTIERSIGEDCEAGVGGWTSSNCVLCKQNVYTPSAGSCNFSSSPPTAPTDDFVGPGNCPRFTGYTPTCLNLSGSGCYIACNDDGYCPSRYTCQPWNNPYAANSPFAGYCR